MSFVNSFSNFFGRTSEHQNVDAMVSEDKGSENQAPSPIPYSLNTPSMGSRAVTFLNTHKVALGRTAIALVIITALGGALLGYMHLSGLGISKAGFAALGHKIVALSHRFKDLMNTKHVMSTAEILYKVALPTTAGIILLALGVMKGLPAIRQHSGSRSQPEIQGYHQLSDEDVASDDFLEGLLDDDEASGEDDLLR